MAQETTKDPPTRTGGRARKRRETGRLAAAVLVTALATLFAALNLDEVEVNWLLGTWDTPLIVVIAVSFVLGALADRLFTALRRRRAS